MSHMPAESEEIVRRLRTPSQAREAFNEVIRQYSEALYRHIRRMVTDHDDTADLLQNTFLKAWNSLENFRGEARLGTWLYKIATNECLTFLRQDSRRRHLSLDDPEGTAAATVAAPSAMPDGDELSRRLTQAIATLPEKQRLVFNMRYYDEMKYEEMSRILGTSVGALKASYHLAAKKIEEYLAG